MAGPSILKFKSWSRRDPVLPPTPQKKGAAANRDKLKAHSVVRQALGEGTLKRGKCEVCDGLRCEAHHDSYERPLEVRWFCRRHHQQLHADIRRASK
jgi:hypothetical protein